MAKIINNGAHVWVQSAELVLAWVRQDPHTPAYTWQAVVSWPLT